MMYGDGVNGTDGHLDALATPLELKLYAVACVLVISLILIGTYTGNSDIYDKIGQEMHKAWKTISKAGWLAIGWLPAIYHHQMAKNLGLQQDTYQGKHRLVTA